MVWKVVQLVFPFIQEMQDLAIKFGLPPQTTSLPPDRTERVWYLLGSGRSGMEHVSEGEGGGKTSKSESSLTPSQPPTTT